LPGNLMPTLTIQSGRARLWAETEGTGAPVVLLHAGVADCRMWRGQLVALAPDFRAVAYDRRGFGRTAHADETYSHVGDLAAVLHAVASSEPAILVGCSQGGRICIDMALAFPQRVRALALVGTAITGASWPSSFEPRIQALIDESEQADADGDVDRINALEAHAWLDGPAEPRGRVGGPARELFLDMNRVALRAEARGEAVEAPPAIDRLDELALPVLVIWGDRDFPHIIDNSRKLAAASGGETFVLPGAAHLPNLEQPAAFNRRLREFCTAVCR
jgi:pimeloyl-ACP methyl ester carboxylesterase